MPFLVFSGSDFGHWCQKRNGKVCLVQWNYGTWSTCGGTIDRKFAGTGDLECVSGSMGSLAGVVESFGESVVGEGGGVGFAGLGRRRSS
ncbi:hypothetical protein GDO78_018922 [Eleutherodactylus coqui]|uniref:Uncharacterized protein n=1 Tax=Eleutherodactylus coqui TaxID=57060 RepID=A0A8J6JV11_ELECQ|nr:hypothetical protein GDO78_018922 [Eleutherodactylus coqui]